MKKIIFILLFISFASSLNILVLLPYRTKSHFIAFEPLLKKLVDIGHEVTVVSYFPQDDPTPGYKDISLDDDSCELECISLDELPCYNPLLSIWGIFQMSIESCRLLHTDKMKSLANTSDKYDLILIETFSHDCFLGFVHKFKTPYIGISSSVLFSWFGSRYKLSHSAYVPNIFLPNSDQMNFSERLKNFILDLYIHYFYSSNSVEMSNTEARKLFGDDLPRLEDIALNMSLLLVNSHFSLNRPRDLPPFVVEVGGLSSRKPRKLPKNIEKWINESTHGVIYFSMGSMIKGHSFPADIRKAFLKAFSKLPQRVLWKWENETLPEQPSNVMIQKWMPQFDILCHPNVKAYISHGGLLGTTEAVHCGVPMVVMPQYGDQFVNAAALQAGGGGVILDFKEATEEKILKALKTILQPSFNKQAKKLSAAYKDRPMPPLDTAVYWVEYVARHGGAHHMKTKAVGMPWYQYLLLDVLAFLIFLLITALAITFYTLRTIFRFIFKNPRKVKTN